MAEHKRREQQKNCLRLSWKWKQISISCLANKENFPTLYSFTLFTIVTANP